MKKLEIYSDSACNNKLEESPMGIGIHAQFRGREIHSMCYNAGIGTSNIGEWIGCIEALLYAASVYKDYDEIHLYSDSQLIVRQLTGEYRVKQEHLKPYRAKAIEVLNRIPPSKFSGITWIKRDKNQRADDLSKEGLQKEPTKVKWL